MFNTINIITYSFVLLILSGCVPSIDCVTPDVNGLVLEKNSGNPISEASIRIEKYPTLRARTDENGKFYIKHKKELMITLLIGDRITFNILNVEKNGYIPQSVELIGWPPCGPIDITVELEPIEDYK